MLDKDGNSLLHLAIARGDIFAATFLIKNGSSTILCKKDNQATPLHLVAQYKESEAINYISNSNMKGVPPPANSLANIASLLLQYHANLDAQDSMGYSPLQRGIECGSNDVFDVFLGHTT